MKYLAGKNILIISPEAWGMSYLSKHHYALALAAAGNRVFFLNPPGQLLTAKNVESVRILSDQATRGLRWMPQNMQRMITDLQITKVTRAMECKPDVVWSFDNSRYFHMDLWGEAFTIHHVVDHHMDYQFEKASSTASLCLAVTRSIAARQKQWNQNSHFIQHGFTPFRLVPSTLPEGKNKIRAAYVGNLLMKSFDIELFFNLATAHDDVDFYLIGSHGKGNLNADLPPDRIEQIATLHNYPNVFLVGEKNFDEAFSLAAQCDIQLALYFNMRSNPENSSKLPFYMYNGKVTVANNFREYEGLGLMRMADSAEEFIRLFTDTINTISYWNNEEKQAARRNYAMENTYSRQLDRIDQLITA